MSGTGGMAGVGIRRSPGRATEGDAEVGAETGSLIVTENNDSSFNNPGNRQQFVIKNATTVFTNANLFAYSVFSNEKKTLI